MALPWKRLRSCLSSLWKKNFRFPQRGFCILGLVFGSAMAEFSFLGFFIVFIKDKNKQDNMRYDAVVSNAKDSLSAFLASFLTYATHQRISPLIEILLTYVIFITGMLILLLSPSPPSDGIFYLAIVLLSVDKSGEAYMDEFAADRRAVDDLTQGINDNKENPNNRSDAWRFIGRSAGALIGSLVISRLSSKLMLKISAIVMGIGCIFFFSYCIYYELTSGDHHHQEDKRKLRPLIKLLPLWTPFLFYYVVDAAGSTFFMEQAQAMGLNEVVYLYLVQQFSSSTLLRLIGWVITKFWSEEIQQEHHARLAKITCGMFICFWICIDAWLIERDRLAFYTGLTDLMSTYVMFIRLFILLGIMNGMVEGMLGEYFCDRVSDQSMHHLEYSFNKFVEGMGKLLGVGCIFVFKGWIGKTVDDSVLDSYYGVLAIITLCALFVFVCLSKTCYRRKKRTDDDDDVSMLEKGNLHSSPKSSVYDTAGASISASSEQTPFHSNLESTYCTRRHHPVEEVAYDYNLSQSCLEIEGTNEDNRDQSKLDSLSQSPESSVYYSTDESSSLSKMDSAKSTSNSKWSILRSRFNDLRHRPAAKTNISEL